MKFLLLFLLIMVAATPALAHRLSVFAYEEQGQLQVESFFSGNRPARNCEVVVTAEGSGENLAQSITDEAGRATLPCPSAGKMVVSVACGEGHRGQWLYTANDIQAEVIPSLDATLKDQGPAAQVDESQLRLLIAQELDKQLAPIRRQLALNSTQQPSLQDILGGIGYLLGLAGLVAYLRTRQKG